VSALRVSCFDYGAGNLHSLVKALEAGGATVTVHTDPVAACKDTDALVLPGVGAFAPAALRLAPGRDAIRTAVAEGLPLLGICLGMQLMLDGSDEGEGQGLGLVPGRVRRLQAVRVPQIGWNQLDDVTDPLLLQAGLRVAYYANSYVARPGAHAMGAVVASSTHEADRFPAAVRTGPARRVVGVQFHPEKSSAPGVAFLRAFLAMAAEGRRSPAITKEPS
jgi:glutamine amidotransferase